MASISDIKSLILNHIASLDSAGKSKANIDTLLEYNKLGEYLNGNYIEGLAQYEELSMKDKNTLQELYTNLKDKFKNQIFSKDKQPTINGDNASLYAEMYTRLKYKRDRDETEQQTLNKLQNVLYQFALDNGYDLNDSAPEEINYLFVIKEVQKMIKTKQDRESGAKKTLRAVNNPYNNSKLQERIKTYIKENNISTTTIPTNNIDLGNGSFDKTATQKTEVCWALASINALLTTEKGKRLLESNSYYDKETGIFAIHLQEAEDNGFHDGIYIITPEDIQNESGKLAEGEGDASAYLIAIKRYFEEVKQSPELADKMEDEKHTVRNMDLGNYSFRFFEILTGGKFSKYDYLDINRPTQKGIGTGGPSACGNFEEVCNIVNNKNGAVVLVCGEHAISVVGVRDGKLIVQESNNSELFSEEYSDLERNHVIFNRIENINGAPAYELSQDDYEHYIQAVSFLKW